MKILERAAAVSFYRIILTDDIHIFIINILLLVVIAIFKIIRRRRINDACRSLPMFVAVRQPQKLIEGLERAYTLYILQSESIVFCWFC